MDHTAPPLPFLRETLVFLALAGILIPLLQRLRINQVIGFLIMGVVVGPFGVGSFAETRPWLSWVTIPRREGVEVLAELGVVFLMFLIGLELSLPRVWALRKWVFGVGSAQVAMCGAAVGLIALAFGNAWQASLVLGLVLSLSSTAVVMQLLSEERTLPSPMGQACFAILMLQDFAVVPLLIIVDLMGRGGPDDVVTALALRGLTSVAVIALVLFLGRKVVVPVFSFFGRHRQPEVFMALTLLLALSIGVITASAGLSMALGAFLAGLLLAETEYRHEVEATIEPFKGLLMGLFFMSVGMGIDVRAVAREPAWLISSVLGLMLLKSALTGLLLRWNGLSKGHALEAGMLLSQGGEFAFIVIAAARGAHLLSPETGQFMLLVVSLSLLATPGFAKLGQRYGRRWDAEGRHRDGQGADTLAMPDVSGHAVVIGFGRVGQMLGQVFDQQGIAYAALEHNVDLVSRLKAAGASVYYGNATRPDLLRKLGLDKAASLIVTTDDPGAAMRVVRNVRAQHADLPIYVRSHDEQHAHALRNAGATVVVPETLEAGLLLTAFALGSVGMAQEDIDAIVSAERDGRTRHLGKSQAA